MKRKVLLSCLLVAVVVLVSLVSGCLFGSDDSPADDTTPTGPPTREEFNTLDSIVKGWANNPPWALAGSLPSFDDYVTLDDLDDYAKLGDLPGTGDFVSQNKLDNFINDLTTAQITALKEKLGITGSSDGGTTPSTTGEVSVVIDSNIDPYQFTTGVTPANAILPIKITNGTVDYQEVKFNLTLQCVSSDGVANVTVDPVATVNAVVMTVTKVPTDPTICQLIYFTWATSEKILVSPGGATIVYVSVTGFTTFSSEVWRVTLSGILVNEL